MYYTQTKYITSVLQLNLSVTVISVLHVNKNIVLLLYMNTFSSLLQNILYMNNCITSVLTMKKKIHQCFRFTKSLYKTSVNKNKRYYSSVTVDTTLLVMFEFKLVLCQSMYCFVWYVSYVKNIHLCTINDLIKINKVFQFT